MLIQLLSLGDIFVFSRRRKARLMDGMNISNAASKFIYSFILDPACFWEWTQGAAVLLVFMQSLKCSIYDIPVCSVFIPLPHKGAFIALILGCHQLTWCHVPYSPLLWTHFNANPLCCYAQCLLMKWAQEEYGRGTLLHRLRCSTWQRPRLQPAAAARTSRSCSEPLVVARMPFLNVHSYVFKHCCIIVQVELAQYLDTHSININ